MKIIKHGKYYFDNDKKLTCPRCKCKFMYTKEDIQKIFYEFVICPECKKAIYLK